MIAQSSLDARYFDGIFESDPDPWDLSSSPYEAAKFEATVKAISDRRYGQALEIGCAHGVLTEKLLGLCERLIAIDISSKALALARERIGDRPGVELRHIAFPKEVPEKTSFDLVVLSEVAYYWGLVDLDRASEWLAENVASNGRIILVHYTGETDYPHTGDEAVEALWQDLQAGFEIERADRSDQYRLDLWRRR